MPAVPCIMSIYLVLTCMYKLCIINLVYPTYDSVYMKLYYGDKLLKSNTTTTCLLLAS
jgi:hypothetical protein